MSHDPDPPPPTVDRIAAALTPRFGLVAGPATQRLVVWLDTADWRLHRQGAALQLRSGPGGTDLVLRRGEHAGITRPVSGSTVAPLLGDALPEGDLRAVVRPWLGPRALLPLAEVQVAERELRVLDAREKTVVRLVLTGPARVVRTSGVVPADGEGPGALDPRLGLEEIRGYGAEAATAAGRLQKAGLAVLGPVTATEVFTAVGLTPGLLPGAAGQPADPDAPARDHVARALLRVLDELEAAVPGTVQDLDPEFLHDLRVAVRRSRSILKLAGDALPEGTAARFAPELRRLGDLTTPSRDLDVHVLDFPHDASRLDTFAAEDLDPLREHLLRHRAVERRALVRGLGSARFTRFTASWRATLDGVLDGVRDGVLDGVRDGTGPADPAGAGDRPAHALAAERIEHADRRLVRAGRRITPASPAEALHALRKRGKELRYTLELFGPLLDQAALRTVIKELKGLQDMLGVFQDSEVQRLALVGFAEQMISEQTARRPVPVITLLAMGELATRLDDDQRRARLDFEERFARFVRPRVRREVARLAVRGGTR